MKIDFALIEHRKHNWAESYLPERLLRTKWPSRCIIKSLLWQQLIHMPKLSEVMCTLHGYVKACDVLACANAHTHMYTNNKRLLDTLRFNSHSSGWERSLIESLSRHFSNQYKKHTLQAFRFAYSSFNRIWTILFQTNFNRLNGLYYI